MDYYLNLEKSLLSVENNTNIIQTENILNMKLTSAPERTFSPLDILNESSEKTHEYSILQILFPFCKEIDNDLKCKKCIKGYILEENKGICKHSPGSHLPNCYMLETYSKCKICFEGFYLKEGKCIEKNIFESDPKNKNEIEIYKKKIDRSLITKSISIIKIKKAIEDEKIDDLDEKNINSLPKENNELNDSKNLIKNKINDEKFVEKNDNKLSEKINPDPLENLNIQEINSKPSNIIKDTNNNETLDNKNKINNPKNQIKRNGNDKEIQKENEKNDNENEKTLEKLTLNELEFKNKDKTKNEVKNQQPDEASEKNIEPIKNEENITTPKESENINDKVENKQDPNDKLQEENEEKKEELQKENDSNLNTSEDKKDKLQEETENSKKLEILNLGPENSILVENLELINEQDESILFPNQRSYLLRRNYRIKSKDGSIIKRQTIDYLLVYFNGSILMGYDQNADKSDGKELVLKDQNISLNCKKVQLNGNEIRSLPSCVECIDPNKFFLKSYSEVEQDVKICAERKIFLNNCKEYDIFSEKCKFCSDNYFLLEDNLQDICLKKIKFCKAHDFIDNSIECKECEEGYILAGRSCEVKKEIANCKNQSDNICSMCHEGFFLYNNFCLHNLAFSFFACPLDSENQCNCGDSSLEIMNREECVEISDDNCLEYENNITCKKCKQQFYLNSAKSCIRGEIPFCLEYSGLINDSQICKRCENNYTLENNICRKVFEDFSKNCFEKEGEKCLKCTSGNYLVDPSIVRKDKKRNSLSICSENVFFNSYSNSNNCLIFNSTSKKCELCIDELYLDEDGNCSTCDLTKKGIDHFNTSCISPTKLISGCELYDEDSCVKCINDDQPKIYDEVFFTSVIREYSNRKLNEFTEKSFFIINKCDVDLDSSCNVQNCDSAVQLSDGKKCCQKCKNGRTGKWKQINDIFFTDSCSDFVEFCDNGKKIKKIPIEFKKYLTCNICLENKILNLNLTEGQTQTECLDQPSNRDDLDNCLIMFDSKCKICKPKFKPSENQEDGNLTCNMIENCKSSDTVGICEQCENGFSLDETKTNCLASPIRNCKQLNTELSCEKCIDGMILSNNKCFQLENNDCLKYDSENCIKCSNETLEKNKLKQIVKLNLTFDSKFTNYQKSMCIDPSFSSLNPKLMGCIRYETPDFCKFCDKDFILQLNGKDQICVKNPNNNSDCVLVDSQLNCIKCMDGKYLEGDRCFEGNLEGCKIYKDQMNCGECIKTYFKIKDNDRDKCFYKYSINNCLKTSIIENNSSKGISIECDECENLFRTKKVILQQKNCLPLRSIANCKNVNPISSKCSECDDLYFLNSNFICQKRENLSIKHCKKFKIDADACETCNDGFNLLEDKLNCELRVFPSILGCKIQQNPEFVCDVCDKTHFKSSDDNICFPVLKKLDNCVQYASPDLCSKCSFGYILSSENGTQKCVIDKLSANEQLNVDSDTVYINSVDDGKETDKDSKNSENIPERKMNSENDEELEKVKTLKSNQNEKNQDKEFLALLDNLSDNSLDNNSETLSIFSIRRLQKKEKKKSKSISFANNNFQKQVGSIEKYCLCGLCEEGYIYSNSQKKCVQVKTKGCFADGENNSCMICKSGYFMNENKNCIKNIQSGLSNNTLIIKSLILLFVILL